MKISILFFKRNIKKFCSIILSLTFFIFIINIVTGFILSVRTNYKTDVVDNSNLYFLEVTNKDINYKFNNNIINKISKIDGIRFVIPDYGLSASFEKTDNTGNSAGALIAVPKEALSYFGIKDEKIKSEYCFINEQSYDKKFSKFNKGDLINIITHLPIVKEDHIEGRPVNIKCNLTNVFKLPELLYFPADTSIIDTTTYSKFLKKGIGNTSKIIIICPKVDQLKNVAKCIENLDKNFIVKYALKTTNTLPKFAVMITLVSSIIIGVLLIITILNVYSSMKQVLILRKRDIGLLYILGIAKEKIYSLFIIEFFLNGVITFLTSILSTVLVSLILKNICSIDILSTYFGIYVFLDFIISIGILVIVGTFHINKLIHKLETGSFYKEVLK